MSLRNKAGARIDNSKVYRKVDVMMIIVKSINRVEFLS